METSKENNIFPSNSEINIDFKNVSIENDLNNSKNFMNTNMVNKGKKLTVNSLKDGRRLFKNKNEFTKYDFFDKTFIEFRQLLYPNLLLNENFTDNINETFSLEACLLSSFVYDNTMLESMFTKFKVKAIIIKDNGGKANVEKINEYVTYIHPVIDFTLKWGKFHSKLMILKFKDFIRIVIPSANITQVNWYYLGEVIWFQDFPILSSFSNTVKNFCSLSNSNNSNNAENEFTSYMNKHVLKHYFNNSKLSLESIGIKFSDYDFSNYSVDLVSTISGRFKVNENDKSVDSNAYGTARIKHILKNLKTFKTNYFLKQNDEISKENVNEINNEKQSKMNLGNNIEVKKLIIQCSSFGKLKKTFVESFCSCFNMKYNDKENQLVIIYPSIPYVLSIENGEDIASALFLNKETHTEFKKHFKNLQLKDGLDFDNQIFHSKVFIGYYLNNYNDNSNLEKLNLEIDKKNEGSKENRKIDNSDKSNLIINNDISDITNIDKNDYSSNSKKKKISTFKNSGNHSNIDYNLFIYAGSHNFSPSAWGNWEKNNTQISSANYELGVLFSLNKLTLEELKDIEQSLIYKLDDLKDLDNPWVID